VHYSPDDIFSDFSLCPFSHYFSLIACLSETTEFLAFFLYTLLARDRLSRALASARITLSALASNGQTSSVASSPVTIYVAQTSYVLGNLPAKLAFHDIIAVDDLRYMAELIFAEFAGLGVLFDPSFFQYLLRGIFANTNNIRQRNPYGFVIGNINANYTRHIISSLS
jgi:hypothetical protein